MTNRSEFVMVTIDPEMCQGHGECVRVAPEVFTLGDDLTSRCTPRQPMDRLPALEHACAACPAGAITVEVRS